MKGIRKPANAMRVACQPMASGLARAMGAAAKAASATGGVRSAMIP